MEDFYLKHGRLVFNFLLSLTHDKNLAEELTQETFYQAIKSIDKFRGDCKPSVWLCQISKHLWFQYLNKKKNNSSLDSLDNISDYNTDLDKSFWERQDKIEMYKKIQTLDKNTKDVIYLRLTSDLSFSEIGEILGKSENWARVTFYRGKQKLIKEVD